MSELFHTSGSVRAYPSRPIMFADLEAFVLGLVDVVAEPFRDSWDDQRDIALIDKRTGDVELIAAQLGSDHVGFYVRSSPSRRIQRLIAERFGVDVVTNRLNHRLDFIMAETASLHPSHAVHYARERGVASGGARRAQRASADEGRGRRRRFPRLLEPREFGNSALDSLRPRRHTSEYRPPHVRPESSFHAANRFHHFAS